MNIREPSARQAFSDTATICEGMICLSLSAAKVRYAVMSLVSEAGSRGSSAACATSVCPLKISRSTYALASMAGGGVGAGGVWARADAKPEITRKKRSARRTGNIGRRQHETAHY